MKSERIPKNKTDNLSSVGFYVSTDASDANSNQPFIDSKNF
jgi:hypothetical protein